MKMYLKNTMLTLLVLLSSVSLGGSGLPRMQDDKTIEKGVLPNGTAYYVVSNSSSKGMADLALVQKTGKGTTDELSAELLAEEVLSGASCMGDGLSPERFFASNAVAAGKDGYAVVGEGRTVYRFRDLMLGKDAGLLDSALVVLMGMADRLAGSEVPQHRKWYATPDNAVIVSGDVDSKEVIRKLRLLSLMTPASESSPRASYQWVESGSSYEVDRDQASDSSVVEVCWRAPRVPEKYAGTVQPYIQRMYLAQLGTIATMRVREEFAKKGIPCASATYKHITSAAGESDEEFSVRVVVGGPYVEDALEVIAATMSSLSALEATVDEVEIARRGVIRRMQSKLEKPVRSNEEYVDVCIKSFVLGIPLVDEADVLKVYTSRSLPIETELRLMKDISASLLDRDMNISVRCSTPEVLDESRARAVFAAGWDKGAALAQPPALQVSDTLKGFFSRPKAAVRSTRKDHLSGGQIWTFASGLKVVYRRMNTSGRIYWSLGLGSGFSSIPDLNEGEGAFVEDLLWLYRIAGMDGKDFRKFLELGNIPMEADVRLSSTFISGVTHKDNMNLLFRALAAVANERELDLDAYSTYQRNENLRLKTLAGTDAGYRAVADSLMNPGYRYSAVKSCGHLSEELLYKAHRFYEERFAKMNDGVLVLVGDIEETELKKQLQMYAGAFRTDKSVSYHPSVNFQPVSGWSTYTVDGRENAIYLALSVPLPLTAENEMASRVAAKVLRSVLATAAEPAGMYLEMTSGTAMTPRERFNVSVSFHQSDEDADVMEALRLVREALSGAHEGKVTDALVAACKDWLKNDIAVRMSHPQYWVDAISMRHICGKDFTTDYKSKVDAVTPAKVRGILRSLDNAGKVEYIISGK